MSGKLIICRGLPASGKSTWANAQVAADLENTIRVNRDGLRLTLHNGEFVKGVTEEKVIAGRNALIKSYLKKGMTVISDDTNLPRRTVVELVKIAQEHGAAWEIKDFTDVSYEECVQRDAIRGVEGGTTVGATVIADLYTRFLQGKPPLDLINLTPDAVVIEPYVSEFGLTAAYIFDIDGTVALMEGKRSPYDYTTVAGDVPNTPVIEVLWNLYDTAYDIIFCSGRPESCRETTEAWLNQHVGVPHKLFMRPTGDTRADYIVKLELFNENIRKQYAVRGVFDDRNQVVELWRKLGLTCFQVAPGEF